MALFFIILLYTLKLQVHDIKAFHTSVDWLARTESPPEDMTKKYLLSKSEQFSPSGQDDLDFPIKHEQHRLLDETCDSFPETEDILLVMKTGATEAYDKLPIHFLTTLTCIMDFILFADMNIQTGQYHIHDALDTISKNTTAGNREFNLYKQLEEYESGRAKGDAPTKDL